MSKWLEENFLERLTGFAPVHTATPPCAQADLLSSAARLDDSDAAAKKLTDHIASCPQCVELRLRLQEFDHTISANTPSEISEVEQRLDAWLKGLLAASSHQTPPAELPHPANSSLDFRPKTRSFRRLPWELAAAAILLIAFGLLYLRRPGVTPIPSPQVAVAPSSQPVVPNSSSPPVTEAPISATNDSPHSKRPAPATPRSTPPTVSTDNTLAHNAQPSVESSPVRPSLSPSQVALSNGASRSADSPNDCPNCPPRQSTIPAPKNFPPVQIAQGTRIFIILQSTTSQNDGRMQFAGRLLLPLALADAVVLQKDTPVAGFAATSASETSVQITEFVHNGIRYKLGKQSSAGLQQATGTGKALQFESGKVVEMWMEESSTYDAAGSAGTRPPN